MNKVPDFMLPPCSHLDWVPPHLSCALLQLSISLKLGMGALLHVPRWSSHTIDSMLSPTSIARSQHGQLSITLA